MKSAKAVTIYVPTELRAETAELVRLFAEEMAFKLTKAQQKKGYTIEWMDAARVPVLRRDLLFHIAKGDPVDVANLAAFLWWHGVRTA